MTDQRDTATPLPRLVLASSSPRRADLLRTLHLAFEVLPVDVDEQIGPDEPPALAARRIAEHKAEAAWQPGTVTIGADTVVVADGRILGKPSGPDDAGRTLRALSGRTHEVVTGVAVVAAGPSGQPLTRSAFATTSVTFRDLTAPEIDWYVATGEPRDKAGSYGIQGAGGLFVASITGNYQNVVGLPLTTLAELVRTATDQSLLAWARPAG